VLLCDCFREPEPQILDYRTQQHKLFPFLAASFAYGFVGKWLSNMHNEVISELEGGDLERLPEVRLLSFIYIQFV
jgi:acyl-CoA oxidase